MEAYDPRGKDFLVWLHSKSGLLTSKSAYIAIHSQENAASTSSSEENIQTFAKLWKVKRFSPRVIVFMWRCLSEAIPTNFRRSRHISSIDYSCPICHEDRETTEHLFLRCNMARAVWFGSHLGWRPSGSNLSFSEIVKSWLDDPRLFCFQVLQFNVLGFVEGKMQAGHGGHPYWSSSSHMLELYTSSTLIQLEIKPLARLPMRIPLKMMVGSRPRGVDMAAVDSSDRVPVAEYWGTDPTVREFAADRDSSSQLSQQLSIWVRRSMTELWLHRW